jgi:hypothetical protein
MINVVGTLKIAILLFDNFTALDVVGPYEVYQRYQIQRLIWWLSSLDYIRMLKDCKCWLIIP